MTEHLDICRRKSMCVLLKHLCRSIILLQVLLVYFTGSPEKNNVLLAKQTTDRAVYHSTTSMHFCTFYWCWFLMQMLLNVINYPSAANIRNHDRYTVHQYYVLMLRRKRISKLDRICYLLCDWKLWVSRIIEIFGIVWCYGAWTNTNDTT